MDCYDGQYTMDMHKAVSLVDENTIGIVVIMGSTYTGHYEDVKLLNDLLVQHEKETKLHVPIHVDAASGGFVAPFTVPDLEWDFRLPLVCSINVSGHKYGGVYAGIGWNVWRDSTHLPNDLVFKINYLGSDQMSFTLNFSKSASNVVGQYYQFVRLGHAGYKAIMDNVSMVTDHLAEQLKQMGIFEILSGDRTQGLPLVAWKLKQGANKPWDEFDLAADLRVR